MTFIIGRLFKKNIMDTIKEVTVYTKGNSSNISTWSNVPYFFTETLISRGIKVNRVDLSPSPVLNRIYSITCRRIFRIIYKNTTYTYFRSLIHFLDARLRIKKAIKKYKSSQVNIFLTFSFSSTGLTKKPAIQFCDWTYDHYINYFANRKPNIFEKWCIQREDGQIEGSDLIFPLYAGVARYMKGRYKNKNIFYLGNVINSLCNVTESQTLEKKLHSTNLLFIGSRKYIEGARCLVNAFYVLRKQYHSLSLNIIGMKDSDFGELPNGVNCYGYLDKGKDNDRKLYYSLLENAKIFVNTTPKWGAFSATLEAMYFYTPVVVTPYNEFVETFGVKIGFGSYCENNSLDLLCANITNILNHQSYTTLCVNAHESVKDFTWDIYIDKMLDVMKEKF